MIFLPILQFTDHRLKFTKFSRSNRLERDTVPNKPSSWKSFSSSTLLLGQKLPPNSLVCLEHKLLYFVFSSGAYHSHKWPADLKELDPAEATPTVFKAGCVRSCLGVHTENICGCTHLSIYSKASYLGFTNAGDLTLSVTVSEIICHTQCARSFQEPEVALADHSWH